MNGKNNNPICAFILYVLALSTFYIFMKSDQTYFVTIILMAVHIILSIILLPKCKGLYTLSIPPCVVIPLFLWLTLNPFEDEYGLGTVLIGGILLIISLIISIIVGLNLDLLEKIKQIEVVEENSESAISSKKSFINIFYLVIVFFGIHFFGIKFLFWSVIVLLIYYAIRKKKKN